MSRFASRSSEPFRSIPIQGVKVSSSTRDAIESLRNPLDQLLAGKLELSGAELVDRVLRLRAAVNASNSVKVPQNAAQIRVDVPSPGGRVLSITNVLDATGDSVLASAEETDPPPEQTFAPTPFETSLPESTIGFTRQEHESKRLGVFVPVWKALLNDRAPAAADAINHVVDFQWTRVADSQILNGDGLGENVVGITNAGSGVASIALSTDTRWANLLKGIEAARSDDFVGPIDLVAHPTAIRLLVEEENASGVPTFRPEVLDRLGVRSIVPSALLATSTAVVGDFEASCVAWIRSPLTVARRDDHADGFVKGISTLAAEARWFFRVTLPKGLRLLTGL